MKRPVLRLSSCVRALRRAALVAAVICAEVICAAQGASAQEGAFRLVVAPGFEAAGDAFGGVVPLRQGELWGLMGPQGEWRAPPAFARLGLPGKGRIPAEKAHQWGVVDAAGHEMTPFAFQAIGRIADWTPMRWGDRWWAVGPDGQPQGQPLPFDVLIGNEGSCMVGRKDGAPMAVSRGDVAGATMLAAGDEMRAPSEGMVPIRQGDLEGHLDCAHGVIVGGAPEAEAAGDFHQGLAALRRQGGWGFGSVYGGDFEIGGQWQAAGDFAEGLAPVQDGAGLWGYVRRDGQMAISPRFTAARHFSGGMAAAAMGGRWGFIGHDGGWLVPPRFASVKDADQGLAAVEQGGRWGVIAVSPLAVAAADLAPLAGRAGQALWWPTRLVGDLMRPWSGPAESAGGCQGRARHVLLAGTEIYSTPAGALAMTLAPGTALEVCPRQSQSGFVLVARAGRPLGWVAADRLLPLD